MDYRTKSLLKYWIKAGHRKGHGIHSPFLYRLIGSVIENKGCFTAYKKLDDAEAFLQFTLEAEKINTQILPDLPIKYGKLIFRLVNEFLPEKIAFYGESYGLNLLYLALADGRAKVEADIPDPRQKIISIRLLEHCEVENVTIDNKNRQNSGNFILINLPNEIDKCKSILQEHLKSPGNNDIVVISGIHESLESSKLWFDYTKNEQVRVSLDLFRIGIVIFWDKLQKEKFILRF